MRHLDRQTRLPARRFARAVLATVAVPLLAAAALAQSVAQWPQQAPGQSQQAPQYYQPDYLQQQQTAPQQQAPQQAYPQQMQMPMQMPPQGASPQGYGPPQYSYPSQQQQPAQQPPFPHGQQGQQGQQVYPAQPPQQPYSAQPALQMPPASSPPPGTPALRPAAQQPLPAPPTQQPQAQPGSPTAAPQAGPVAAKPTGALQQPTEDLRPERVEADVSTRSVAITSSFTGTEIIVFGSVENSRQQTAESGLYDVAITLEGMPQPVVARKKENVGGIWINTKAQTFEGVPSYYAIVSTRPVAEIADPALLRENEIGFEHILMKPVAGAKAPAASEIGDFKEAVIRRKQAEKLYQKSDYGVVFIGRSLFRSTVSLPANVPVGPLLANVYLFKDGKLLSKYSSKVTLQREGIERYMHDFAFDYPFLYGLFAVFVAVAAGLIASSLFKKGSH